jgi:hypothetical protein
MVSRRRSFEQVFFSRVPLPSIIGSRKVSAKVVLLVHRSVVSLVLILRILLRRFALGAM